MRWHVELSENGKTLVVEHVDDVDVARDTATEFIRDTHGGRKSIPEPQISKAMAEVMDEDYADAEVGQEWTYEVDEGYVAIIAALDDADIDDDCWKCQGIEAISA